METICRRHPVFTWLVCYQDGRIWNEKSQRWLKGALKSGHFRTDLQIEGKRYQPLIHTLIFEAFNGTYEKNKYDVHHINEIPTDNRLENLILLTKSEHHKLHSNTKEWKERVSKLGKRTFKENRTPKCVLQYSKDGVLLKEYKSITMASKETGIAKSGIWKSCNNVAGHKTAGNFIWEYKDVA